MNMITGRFNPLSALPSPETRASYPVPLLTDAQGRLITAVGGDPWTVNNVPSTATQATVSKAAGGAGKYHVVRGIVATIACGATAQTPIQVYIRDGASGVGTIIFATTVAAPANAQGGIALLGLNIKGSANTAMTLEFSGAGVAASQEVVTLIGETVT